MKNLIKNTVMMIAALLVSASCNGNNSVRQKKDAQSETAKPSSPSPPMRAADWAV